MAFFTHLGNVWITLKDGSKILMNDITAFATISKEWKQNAQVQIAYHVRDGERPEMISNRLYGTVDYWWTILLMNDIFDFDNQWPRTRDQLKRYIALKYPNKNPSDIHHYVNPQGLVVDLLSTRIDMGLYYTTPDSQVINAANLQTISIQEFEEALNETKREIILIDPDYIETVQRQFETLMAGNSNE